MSCGVVMEGEPDTGGGRESKGGGTGGQGGKIYNIGIRTGLFKKVKPRAPVYRSERTGPTRGVCSPGILAGSYLHTYKPTLSLAYE